MGLHDSEELVAATLRTRSNTLPELNRRGYRFATLTAPGSKSNSQDPAARVKKQPWPKAAQQ